MHRGGVRMVPWRAHNNRRFESCAHIMHTLILLDASSLMLPPSYFLLLFALCVRCARQSRKYQVILPLCALCETITKLSGLFLPRPTSCFRLHTSSFSVPSACAARDDEENVRIIFDKRQGQAYAHCGWT